MLGNCGERPAISVPYLLPRGAGDDVPFRVRIVHALCIFGTAPDGRIDAVRVLRWADDLEIESAVLAVFLA
jgi:hypothetical protein